MLRQIGMLRRIGMLRQIGTLRRIGMEVVAYSKAAETNFLIEAIKL